MVLNNGAISIIIIFIVLSIFTAVAKNENPSTETGKHTSECAKKEIQEQMQITANKTWDFVRYQIGKRLDDMKTGEVERKCLMSCYQGYERAAESMARAIKVFSESEHDQVARDVAAYTKAIESCLQCSAKSLPKDAELLEFQKWAKRIGEELRTKLGSCK